jgi:hypothetical protein
VSKISLFYYDTLGGGRTFSRSLRLSLHAGRMYAKVMVQKHKSNSFITGAGAAHKEHKEHEQVIGTYKVRFYINTINSFFLDLVSTDYLFVSFVFFVCGP